MNIIYKWIPYDIWHKTEYELWFKELADSGLQIQKVGRYWGKFKKVEPKTREYRLCFNPNNLGRTILTECNWKKIETPSDFDLFESDIAQHSDELYKNKDLQVEDLILIVSKCKKQFFWYLIILLLILVILFSPRSYYTLSLVSTKFNLLGFYILILFTSIYRDLRTYRGLKGLEESLRNGTKNKHIKIINTSTQKSFYLALLCCVFIIAFIELKAIGNEKIPLPLEDMALPVIQLSSLENASTLKRDPDHEQYSFYNYYEKYWNLFAFRIYESDEDGILDTQEYIDNHPNVETEFYELTFKRMREPLVKDLIQRYQDKITIPYKDIVRQDANGLDGIYILDESHNIELIGMKDNRVMYVKYSGNGTLDDVIEEISRKIVF